MKLNYQGLKDAAAWAKAGIELPPYDVEALAKATVADPRWVHFGIGNIFRIFVGSIEDKLLREGLMDRGITCVETFDYDVVDKIYTPYDNLALAVYLKSDGTVDKQVLGGLSEAIKAQSSDPAAWARLKAVFTNPGLQLVTFTITEKGYALRNTEGRYFGYVQADMDNGPEKVTGAMGVVAAMLYARYQAGKLPLALVSMDNVARNGEKLRNSVMETAMESQLGNYNLQVLCQRYSEFKVYGIDCERYFKHSLFKPGTAEIDRQKLTVIWEADD